MKQIKVNVIDTLDYDVKFYPSNFKSEKEVAVHLIVSGAMLCNESMTQKDKEDVLESVKEILFEEMK